MQFSPPPHATTTDRPDPAGAAALSSETAPALCTTSNSPQRASTARVKAPAGPRRGWRAIDAPARVQTAEVGSRFLYVAEQGAVLRREGTRVVVAKKDAVLLQVPAVRLQGVLVYGSVQVTTACFRNLLAEQVWVSFFTRSGQYRGRLQPPCERGGRVRRRQWTQANDPAFCLEFARAIVRGKILAQQRLAEAYAKNRAAESLGTGRIHLRESLERVDEAADLATLRGIEGTASRAYFDLFSRWNSSELPFPGREKRGTNDPVNALLNFGYTLLTRELEGLTEAAGLDPTIGFYHAPDDDRPSLACDWVEEFRHVVVDRLVLTLLNKRTISRDDFEDGEERRGVRLTADGLRKFLSAYELGMRRPPEDDDASAAAGLTSVLLAQLGRLLDALAGRAPYRSHLELPAAEAVEPAESPSPV
jgi:CRISPR-associated protein Cas1